MRRSVAFFIALLAGIACAQTPDSVIKLAEHINQMAAREPAQLSADVRLEVADALRSVDPELGGKMADQVLNEVSARDPWLALRMVLGMAPLEAASMARRMPVPADVPDYRRAVDALIAGGAENLKLARELAWRDTAPSTVGPDRAVQKTAQRLRELRGDISKADRAKLAESLAAEIRAIPNPEARLGLASALSNYATEGDLGHDALQAVTETLGLAIRDARPKVYGRQYLDLAKLVRYEHMRSPIDDPSLESRIELLHLRELAAEQTDFTLTAIDGKTYSLKDLRGKMVVVNFWATWCPPCRKEMPDLEDLSKRYRDQGLLVLAISDEAADTVKPFIAKQGYTVPVLLDPDRKVNRAFHVEGIPKTFVFDRQGKLAAQAIDMRTKDQFLVLLKQAGIK